uniref:Uncharacterized protein n=1 Tax=Arundo donax TaxID=35708 RepID=A0A0A9HMS7_ARUDO
MMQLGLPHQGWGQKFLIRMHWPMRTKEQLAKKIMSRSSISMLLLQQPIPP